MIPAYENDGVIVYCGHVLDVLRELPENSVHCVVTSPPYWGLRAYGTNPVIWAGDKELCEEHEWAEFIRERQTGGDSTASAKQISNQGSQISKGAQAQAFCVKCGAWRGELGLEPTPDLFVSHMVQIFREVRRVLREDGTLWLNLGDSYAGSWGAAGHRAEWDGGESTQREKNTQTFDRGGYQEHRDTPPTARPQNGLKPKDLVGIPWRVALALQADGWYLRSDIIWSKPNPMPESVRDRPTKAHEYLFLLSKSPRYFYDADAIREPLTEVLHAPKNKLHPDKISGPNDRGGHSQWEDTDRTWGNPAGRNRRTVWTISTQAYKGAHFATYPAKLVEPCILAGTSEKGVCPTCGAPWVRVTEKHAEIEASRHGHLGIGPKTVAGGTAGTTLHHDITRNTITWIPTCSCDISDTIPATVMDIFMGSGTTALVAINNNRRAVGIELSEKYLPLIQGRLARVERRLPNLGTAPISSRVEDRRKPTRKAKWIQDTYLEEE